MESRGISKRDTLLEILFYAMIMGILGVAIYLNVECIELPVEDRGGVCKLLYMPPSTDLSTVG
jgi:hypothetical protein